jgi:hypothetical protein
MPPESNANAVRQMQRGAVNLMMSSSCFRPRCIHCLFQLFAYFCLYPLLQQHYMPPKPVAAAAATSDVDELRALVEALAAEVEC